MKLTLEAAIILVAIGSGAPKIEASKTEGYEDILIKIDDHIKELSCSLLIKRLEVNLKQIYIYF